MSPHRECRSSHVGCIEISPHDADTIYVAVTGGRFDGDLRCLPVASSSSSSTIGASNDLYEILEERYGRRSTILTSQIPVDKWGETGHKRFGSSTPRWAVHPSGPPIYGLAAGDGWRKGGGVQEKGEEQPHALRNYLTTRHPDGALMLLNCYLSFPSSAKVARDCLINSANSRL